MEDDYFRNTGYVSLVAVLSDRFLSSDRYNSRNYIWEVPDFLLKKKNQQMLSVFLYQVKTVFGTVINLPFEQTTYFIVQQIFMERFVAVVNCPDVNVRDYQYIEEPTAGRHFRPLHRCYFTVQGLL